MEPVGIWGVPPGWGRRGGDLRRGGGCSRLDRQGKTCVSSIYGENIHASSSETLQLFQL